jgi:hypothetical protein
MLSCFTGEHILLIHYCSLNHSSAALTGYPSTQNAGFPQPRFVFEWQVLLPTIGRICELSLLRGVFRDTETGLILIWLRD